MSCLEHFIGLDRWHRPSIKPFRLFGPHINASVTLRCAKVAMPIGAVECDAGVIEEGYPWHPGQLISFKVGRKVAVPHVPKRGLLRDVKMAFGGCSGNAVLSRTGAGNAA